MEISWRIRMSKHSSAVIHGHSALKKLTGILHVFLLHCSPCIGEETTIRCFIHELLQYVLHRPNNKARARCKRLCRRFPMTVNENIRDQHVAGSICLYLRQISLPVARLGMWLH